MPRRRTQRPSRGLLGTSRRPMSSGVPGGLSWSMPRAERGIHRPVSPLPQPQPVWVIAGPLAAGDAADLCERLRVVLTSSDAAVVVCDGGRLPADIATVDALARLQLTARRLGGRIELRSGSPQLDRLL